MDKINWSKFTIYHTDDKDLDCSKNKIFHLLKNQNIVQ